MSDLGTRQLESNFSESLEILNTVAELIKEHRELLWDLHSRTSAIIREVDKFLSNFSEIVE